MKIYEQPIRPIVTGTQVSANIKTQTATNTGKSFTEVLNTQLAGQKKLTISKHAMQRAQERGINLGQNDLQRLDTATDRAMAKGISQTLVMMDSNAFIINVPNRVVVTLIDNGTEEAIFTNIDGAVIV